MSYKNQKYNKNFENNYLVILDRYSDRRVHHEKKINDLEKSFSSSNNHDEKLKMFNDIAEYLQKYLDIIDECNDNCKEYLGRTIDEKLFTKEKDFFTKKNYNYLNQIILNINSFRNKMSGDFSFLYDQYLSPLIRKAIEKRDGLSNEYNEIPIPKTVPHGPVRFVPDKFKPYEPTKTNDSDKSIQEPVFQPTTPIQQQNQTSPSQTSEADAYMKVIRELQSQIFQLSQQNQYYLSIIQQQQAQLNFIQQQTGIQLAPIMIQQFQPTPIPQNVPQQPTHKTVKKKRKSASVTDPNLSPQQDLTGQQMPQYMYQIPQDPNQVPFQFIPPNQQIQQPQAQQPQFYQQQQQQQQPMNGFQTPFQPPPAPSNPNGNLTFSQLQAPQTPQASPQQPPQPNPQPFQQPQFTMPQNGVNYSEYFN